ncbi:hypothetical protein WA158_000930 [Blastocystis sp. Blastoise]
MFIKKDLRKIPEILDDEYDDCKDLFLARRSPEFQGTIDLLVSNVNKDRFKNTQYLSLNSNMLHTVNGIGIFNESPLKFLTLSNNKLETLSQEIRYLYSLETLLLEDNQLQSFPDEIIQLTNLKTLRLTGNPIKNIPSSIEELTVLETIALDNCQLETVPDSLFTLLHLQTVLLGNNHISSLPSVKLLQELKFLAIDSNQLNSLPEGLSLLPNLMTLYANKNSITNIDEDWACNKNTTVINLEHNQIQDLPSVLRSIWLANGQERKGLSLKFNPILINDEDLEDNNPKRRK